MGNKRTNREKGHSERIVEYHFNDEMIVIDGVAYPMFAINCNHPVLLGLNSKQIFDIAFDLGGEIRGLQYQSLIQSVIEHTRRSNS